MRMKKLFTIGILLMLFTMVSAFIPDKSVRIDDDVGITYVIADQIEAPAIADFAIIGESDYSCTWEKLSMSECDYINYFTSTTWGICYVEQDNCLCWHEFANNNISDLNGQEYLPVNDNRGANARLDIGETINWHLPRHTNC